MKTFWKNTAVLVTGGNGFIGSFVVEKLVALGARVTVMDRMSTGRLRHIGHLQNKIKIIKGDCTNLTAARVGCRDQQIVINLAAHVGGIAYNTSHQATMLRDNLAIAGAMLEAARLEKSQRFLILSSACVYPHDAIVPTPESEGFRGEPEPTNSGYGWGKRMAEKLGMLYAEEFGLQVGIVRPYNAYGPRDNFDANTSHVIPALIRRVIEGENPLIVWGSGRQTRAFLYVEDLAEGIITAIEKNPTPAPVNLGSNEEVSVGDLARLICKAAGVTTKIHFNTSRPDGSPRRSSDNTLARQKFGFTARTTLADGLARTVSWYMSSK